MIKEGCKKGNFKEKLRIKKGCFCFPHRLIGFEHGVAGVSFSLVSQGTGIVQTLHYHVPRDYYCAILFVDNSLCRL